MIFYMLDKVLLKFRFVTRNKLNIHLRSYIESFKKCEGKVGIKNPSLFEVVNQIFIFIHDHEGELESILWNINSLIMSIYVLPEDCSNTHLVEQRMG